MSDWAEGMTRDELDEFTAWLAADWERQALAALSPEPLPGAAGKGPGPRPFDWLR